jgi:formylmethanofuran dehydrogenase subunit B
LCHDEDTISDEPDFDGCPVAKIWAIDDPHRDAETADADVAIATAADRLRAAIDQNRCVVFRGLEHLHWQGQKAAVSLAQRSRATVVAASEFGADPWNLTFAQKGAWTATWTEIRARSDAIVLWYAPLWNTHPRWLDRFAPASTRVHRLAVVANGRPLPPEGWIEEQFLRIDPGHAVAYLRAVRQALRSPDAEPTDESVRKLVHLIRQAHWATVVRGDDPPEIADPFAVAESWTDLIAEANNADRRCVMTYVPKAVNAGGLEAILSIRAGLAAPMRFSAAGPISVTCEIDAADAEFEVSFDPQRRPDGGRPGLWFCQGVESDCDIGTAADSRLTVVPVARLGRDESGIVVRADGVAIPVPALRKSSRISIVEALHRIEARMQDLKMANADRNADEPELRPSPGDSR